MKVVALEPIRYNNRRIEAGEEFIIDNETWQKIKDKGIVKMTQFGNQTENKNENKIENKTEKKGGR